MSASFANYLHSMAFLTSVAHHARVSRLLIHMALLYNMRLQSAFPLASCSVVIILRTLRLCPVTSVASPGIALVWYTINSSRSSSTDKFHLWLFFNQGGHGSSFVFIDPLLFIGTLLISTPQTLARQITSPPLQVPSRSDTCMSFQ
ncbi:hypothetical protein V8C34DRAFT_191008 [Trichoderma compactum]